MRPVTYLALIRKKPIKEFLVDKLDEEGLILIELLYKANKFVSEFTLAERSGIYVNTVRSLMYKLYEHKIVNYTRQREKTRGWYIYFWKLNPEKLVSYVIGLISNKKKELERTLETQSKDRYFYCKKCDVKLQFAEAMEYNFSCPQCFEQMTVTSPKKENKEIKQQINKLDKKINKLKKVKKRLEWMEEKRKEKERKKKAKEEAERKALAKKGMYFCTKCNHAHKKKSKIGKKHKKHAK